jgi:hypothetical protein
MGDTLIRKATTDDLPEMAAVANYALGLKVKGTTDSIFYIEAHLHADLVFAGALSHHASIIDPGADGPSGKTLGTFYTPLCQHIFIFSIINKLWFFRNLRQV